MSSPRNRGPRRADPHLVLLLSRGLFEYGQAIREGLLEHGFGDVPRSGSRLLATLSEAPATVGELADTLRSTKQGVSRLSDAMVERGYLRRSSDRDDHRLVRLALTARGRSAAQSVFAAVAEVDRAIERRAGKSGSARAQKALAEVFGTPRQP